MTFMEKKKIKLKPCQRTFDDPFNPRMKNCCPIFAKVTGYLDEKGWERKNLVPSTTPQGHMCYMKYNKELSVRVEGEKKDVVYTVELTFDCVRSAYGNSCQVNTTIGTFEKDNYIVSLHLKSEAKMLEGIERLLEEQ